MAHIRQRDQGLLNPGQLFGQAQDGAVGQALLVASSMVSPELASVSRVASALYSLIASSSVLKLPVPCGSVCEDAQHRS